MAGEWLETTWGALATLEYGKALRDYQDTPSIARVFGTNGPIGWHDKALWYGPGVIVGRKGAYRGIHYTEDPYWVIDTAYSLQPKECINLRWAYYQLKSIDLNNVDDGSPIPSTTRPAFYALSVSKPPRATQDRIADLLSSLDDKIELNRRMGQTLEAMARALFRSWFVDFDPVRAKAELRPTGLPDDLAAVFANRFGEDGLPSGWTRRPLGELFEVSGGNTPSTGNPAFSERSSPMGNPQGLIISHLAGAVADGASAQRCRFTPMQFRPPAAKKPSAVIARAYWRYRPLLLTRPPSTKVLPVLSGKTQVPPTPGVV